MVAVLPDGSLDPRGSLGPLLLRLLERRNGDRQPAHVTPPHTYTPRDGVTHVMGVAHRTGTGHETFNHITGVRRCHW